MRRPDDPEVNSWLTKVAEDYRVAQLLAESAEPLDDAICFHCERVGRDSAIPGSCRPTLSWTRSTSAE